MSDIDLEMRYAQIMGYCVRFVLLDPFGNQVLTASSELEAWHKYAEMRSEILSENPSVKYTGTNMETENCMITPFSPN
jgi:hypothetical protein